MKQKYHEAKIAPGNEAKIPPKKILPDNEAKTPPSKIPPDNASIYESSELKKMTCVQ